MKVYNMDQVLAANIMNTWLAVSNVLPLIGAFVADAYLGKFRTIAIGSFASLAVHALISLIGFIIFIIQYNKITAEYFIFNKLDY